MGYPTTPATFTTKADGASNTISAAHMNDVQTEIAALEAALLTTGLAHHLKFVDATYDIGQSGATRPRHYFGSGNMVLGGTLNVTGAATLLTTLTGKGLATTPVVSLDVSGDTLTLADDATAVLTGTYVAGLIYIYDATNGEDALFAFGAASRIINQKAALWTTTNTDTKNSVEWAANAITIRNRSGASAVFRGFVLKVG